MSERLLEVVDLVVDLEPPNAAHEAGGDVQEVPCATKVQNGNFEEKLKNIN